MRRRAWSSKSRERWKHNGSDGRFHCELQWFIKHHTELLMEWQTKNLYNIELRTWGWIILHSLHSNLKGELPTTCLQAKITKNSATIWEWWNLKIKCISIRKHVRMTQYYTIWYKKPLCVRCNGSNGHPACAVLIRGCGCCDGGVIRIMSAVTARHTSANWREMYVTLTR